MMSKGYFWISIIALMIISICMIMDRNLNNEKVFYHPDYKMEATCDEETRTIYWKGENFKQSPLGTIHLEATNS